MKGGHHVELYFWIQEEQIRKEKEQEEQNKKTKRKGTKKNYDKAYDYFFAEFMAAFSCVQYQWISDIVNRD